MSARRRVLSDDACPRCGTTMVERRSALKAPVNGEEVTVPSALHLRCTKCDEIVLRLSDARRLQEDAIAGYRKKHGLLSADEIAGPLRPILSQRSVAVLLDEVTGVDSTAASSPSPT